MPLDRAQRRELLELFAPVYPDAVADHVTLAIRVPRKAELPGAVEAEIVARIDAIFVRGAIQGPRYSAMMQAAIDTETFADEELA